MDLGAIFDDQLTFGNHIDHLGTVARRMYGAYRFIRDIGSPEAMLGVFMVYIVPIMEYASPIRSQNRIGIEGNWRGHLGTQQE